MQFLPERKPAFDKSLIRYSQCWEDSELVLDAMQVSAGQILLSIASAGDNSLSLLTTQAKVIAIDFCPAQLALVALKMAAFRSLDYQSMLAFLGVKPSNERRHVFARLRNNLAEPYRSYFDQRLPLIDAGVINTGKLERYFSVFRKVILPLVHNKATVNALFEQRSRDERESFFSRRWNTKWYQFCFNLFFSQTTMALLGREASFFDQSSGSLSTFLSGAARAALTAGEPRHNHYLRWILTGEYLADLPHYLRLENFETIRANLDNLVLVEGDLQTALFDMDSSCIDAFNLSDVFEYLDHKSCQSLSRELRRVAKPGARMVYWNMAVDRLANTYEPGLIPGFVFSGNSAAAHSTFFYKRFCLDIASEGAA